MPLGALGNSGVYQIVFAIKSLDVTAVTAAGDVRHRSAGVAEVFLLLQDKIHSVGKQK